MNKDIVSVAELVEYGRGHLGISIEAGRAGLRRTLTTSAVSILDESGGVLWEAPEFSASTVIITSRTGGFSPAFFSCLAAHAVGFVVCPAHLCDEDLRYFRRFAEATGTVLATSGEDPWYVESRLVAFLRERLEGIVSVHGVLMDVEGVGVLIRGKSGSGKSQCALELLRRGHRLVADDRAILHRDCSGTVRGSVPATIKNLMYLRRLGIVDTRALFGVDAVSDSVVVDLACEMAAGEQGAIPEGNSRLRLLGKDLPMVALPFRKRRSAADTIEVAARMAVAERPA